MSGVFQRYLKVQVIKNIPEGAKVSKWYLKDQGIQKVPKDSKYPIVT